MRYQIVFFLQFMFHSEIVNTNNDNNNKCKLSTDERLIKCMNSLILIKQIAITHVTLKINNFFKNNFIKYLIEHTRIYVHQK